LIPTETVQDTSNYKLVHIDVLLLHGLRKAKTVYQEQMLQSKIVKEVRTSVLTNTYLNHKKPV